MTKKKEKKKKDNRNRVLTLVFIIGLLIALYPQISNLYYRQVHTDEINSFIEGKDKIPQEELERKMELARQYNNTLDPSRLADPYTEKEKEGIAEYARMLEVEEKIGFIEIPQIDQKLPVYAGTSDNILEKSAGHLEGTSLPVGGKSTHAVVTAHRGLPKAKLFRELDKLKIGDVFYYHNIADVLAYEVDQILTVEPWDFEPVLVVEGEDYFTLLTCTPYMINSHRLLVRGHRVDYVAPEEEEALSTNKANTRYRDYLYYVIGAALIVLLIFIYNLHAYRKTKKKVMNLKNREEKK